MQCTQHVCTVYFLLYVDMLMPDGASVNECIMHVASCLRQNNFLLPPKQNDSETHEKKTDAIGWCEEYIYIYICIKKNNTDNLCSCNKVCGNT